MSSPGTHAFDVHHHVRIPARDGVLLSANLWLPRAQFAARRFPAVLEMIPYRKDDWRYESDHARMGYLAERGFAGCR
ncbi:MAG: peptidase S15, partial [Chloroflexi bacterium]|nr:peptidase S15 [Chloroflexota bacterium]